MSFRFRRLQLVLAIWLFASQPACSLIRKLPPSRLDTQASYHDTVGLEIEYPQVVECANEESETAAMARAPRSLEDPSQIPKLELSLAQAIQRAIGNGPVLRTIGGTVVQAPSTTTTIYDPALSHANPIGGVEAALSAFDAQLSEQLTWQKIDEPNNFAGLPFQPLVSQSTRANFTAGISKQTAQGAQFALRNIINYDRNEVADQNQFRAFPSASSGYVEAEWRQPLMRGAGTEYNRIAGPGSAIGQYNGVLIARINDDVSLADFEAAVITLISDVEEAYWSLYLSYRSLEANLRGRESALKTYQYQQAQLAAGSGRKDNEVQALALFQQFQGNVENALAGSSGLYSTEQRLRYLVGLPATDDKLIMPTSEPTHAEIVYDWSSALGQAISRRVEIRRQKWNIKRRELEVKAAKLNRQPQLDFLGKYRWRGLGDHLIGDRVLGDPLDNLYSSILGGSYQEWEAGLELSFPVGLRAANAAVTHAKLNLARERALLNETEVRISHDLSDAARELKRAYVLIKTHHSEWQANISRQEILEARHLRGKDDISFSLQAKRDTVSSESAFYQALLEYNLAIRDLHRQKGTLLPYNQVQLNEQSWVAKAYRDAHQVGRFFTPRKRPAAVNQPSPVSTGPFDPSIPGNTDPAPPEFLDAPVTAPEVPESLLDATEEK